MNDQVRAVPSAEWHQSVASAQLEGFGHFDWLGAVDEIGRAEEFRVICRLLDASSMTAVRLETRVERSAPRLATIGDLFAGARWHEREAHDFFGIEFVGADLRPLLLRPGYHGHPLRKDEVLAARAGQPWPGAKEPGESGDAAAGRRRMAPAGVPEPEIWGERTGESATPAEIAESSVGGRIRRRR